MSGHTGVCAWNGDDDGTRQGPSSGHSCFGNRAGFTQQRARGSCRAAHEAAACSSARVKPGPETYAVDVADPADGQKLGWLMDSERMGSPGRRVCETLRGLSRVFCSQSALRRLRTGRAHVLAWGTPRNVTLACYAQGDVMAARMVGIRQEGNPCRMVPSKKGRGARSANSCHDVTEKDRGCELPRWCAGCELPRWWCAIKGKKKKKQASLRVNRIPRQGVEDPLVWAQEGTS